MARRADADVAALLNGAELVVPPPPLPANTNVPVAVWRTGVVGAVLFISHDPTDSDEPFSLDIDAYELVADAWLLRSSGGSDWPVPFGQRPTIASPVLTGYSRGLPPSAGSANVWLASGIAPNGVSRVRATVGTVEYIINVEPVTDAFLLGVPELTLPPGALSSAD